MSKSVKKPSPKTPSYLRKSILKYQKVSVKRVSLVFYRDDDAALIEKIDTVKNMSAYLKNLILSDIENNPSEPINKDKSALIKRYHKSDERRVSFLVNREKSANIIKRLAAQSSVSNYIKTLIANDI